jgi:ribosome modulation factor
MRETEITERSPAWWSGFNSYLSDIDRDANPYWTNRREREDWYDGWDAARDD